MKRTATSVKDYQNSMNNSMLVGYILRCMLSICLSSLIAPSCHASTTKNDIARKIEADTKQILEQNTSSSGDSGAVNSEVINTRSKRLSDTVLLLKSDQVDDDIAQWIEQSVSQLVSSRSATLASSTPDSISLFQNLTQQAEKRFKSLDNVKGKQLLEKRRAALISEKTFRHDLENFVVGNLSGATTYRVELDPTASLGTTGAGFIGVIHSLDLDQESKPVAGKAGQSNLDLLNKQIESRLLVLVLVRQIRSAFASDAHRGAFSYGNLLSGFYDDDGPFVHLSPKDFATVQPEIVKLYQSWCMNVGGVTVINPHRFDVFFNQCASLRVSQTFSRPEAFTSGEERGMTVSFNNDKNVWPLLIQVMQQ